MDKINNWLARNSNVIAALLTIFGYTVYIFLLGAIWQLEQDLKEVQKLEIHTKIIEYRLGDIKLGADTLRVVKEEPKAKMKAENF